MAFGYDGSVRIKADLNHQGFDRGISSMTNKVKSFGSTLSKIAGMVAVAFGTAAIVNFAKESVNAASALNDAWIGLQSIVEGQGRSFSSAKSFIQDYIADGLVPLENAVTAYKNLAARGYDDTQIQKTLTALKDAAAFGRQSSYSLGEAVATATEGLKNENSILVDNAGVTKNVAKMWEDYAKSIGVSVQSLTQEQKILAEVNGILEETRFQTGDAAKLVNTYSGQVALLGFNFQNLKVQVGQALMPIAQAVLPGINAIISALTKLATVFAQVTALLFGKSTQVTAQSGIASSATDAAGATDDLADATAGAGKASEKAGKQMKGVLAGFDELNILADDTASSLDDAANGLGSDVSGIEIPTYEADIGDIENLENAYKSLGEIFVDTLDSMLAGIPKLKEAFASFADNFNNLNRQIYDGFKFDGVKERVQQLGKELAGAFNGLIQWINFEQWGRTLGAGLDLGLQFLVNFLYAFNWIAIGKKLAYFVNGLVAEVDWEGFGKLLWAKFKFALETLAGFILGLKMPELAKAASNIVIGFFNEMKNTLDNIPWDEIGAKIAEFLNNIKWDEIIASISGALESLVKAGVKLIGGFITNADPETLVLAFGVLFNILFGKLVAKTIKEFAKNIATGIFSKISEELGKGDISSIFTNISTKISEFGGNVSKVFSLSKDSTHTFGEAVREVFGPASIIAGIAGLIAGAGIAITNFLDMLENGFSWANEALMLLGIGIAAVSAIILGAPALVTGVIAAIVAVVATAVVLVKEHWEEIKEAFSAAWEKIKEIAGAIAEWFNTNVIDPVKKFFSELWENIKQLASDAWNGIQEIWNVVSGWFNDNVITPVSNFFSELWDNIGALASDIWEKIKGVWSEAGQWFDENVGTPLGKVFDAAVEVAKNAFNGIISGIEGMINSVIKAINWLIQQLNKIKFDVPDWVPAVGGKSFGFNIPTVSSVTLPRLANGAVIPPNQQFMAILGDQRSGTNIEAPLATIKQALRDVMSETGFGGDINITVESVLDGKVVARNTVRHINTMTRSSGKSPLLT